MGRSFWESLGRSFCQSFRACIAGTFREKNLSKISAQSSMALHSETGKNSVKNFMMRGPARGPPPIAGAQSKRPRRSWKRGQKQHPGPENQDSQHKANQPRGGGLSPMNRARKNPINIKILGRTVSGTNGNLPWEKRDPSLGQTGTLSRDEPAVSCLIPH